MRGTINNRRFGFTLLELLVVLAIIVALVALLAPVVMTMQEKSNVRVAQSWIGNFNKALDAYTVDHGSYPTTEQGLNALIYVPLNEGYAQGMIQQPGFTNPNDPNAGMNLGATGLSGPDALNNPMTGMTDPMTGGPAGGLGMPTTPGMPDAMSGMPPGDAGMMPSTGGIPGDMNSMAGTTGFGSGWTQPQFNPQLYVNAKKRLDPYLSGDKVEHDPWKRPYRYSYSLVNGINPLTGDRRPAIWSAGYDGIDHTDDDIRSWDPKVAAEQLALQQQQYQMGGMGGVDAMGNPLQPGAMGGGFDAMGNPLQPGMGGNMMNPMGTQPNMMMPNQMGTQPNMMMPNQMGTQPNMMMPNQMGTQPNMMPPNQMGTQPNMMPPNQMGTQPNMMPPQPPM